jgi:F1F0 ATPase subunit 2
MNLTFILIIISGIALGCFFFGGLLLTVKMGTGSKSPAIWFSMSFILRISVTLLVFFLLGQGQLSRILFCLSGFIIGRAIITWLSKNSKA